MVGRWICICRHILFAWHCMAYVCQVFIFSGRSRCLLSAVGTTVTCVGTWRRGDDVDDVHGDVDDGVTVMTVRAHADGALRCVTFESLLLPRYVARLVGGGVDVGVDVMLVDMLDLVLINLTNQLTFTMHAAGALGSTRTSSAI